MEERGAGGRVRCEFALMRYVPDPVKGEFLNIGVVLREAGSSRAQVRFTRDWARVRCLDPEADVEMLQALEGELAERFLEEPDGTGADGTGADGTGSDGRRPVLEVLAGSLSNCLQMTAMRATLAESLPAEMDALLRRYVEGLRVARGQRTVTGRAALARTMRDGFERAGVWALLRKRVPAREYTGAGDPLRLDCGYRNEAMRLFHAVSLEVDAELAKGLAYSLPALRAGVERVEGIGCELTAMVEPVAEVSDPELYRFGVDVMEGAGLRVLTVADMGRVAETARRELRV